MKELTVNMSNMLTFGLGSNCFLSRVGGVWGWGLFAAGAGVAGAASGTLHAYFKLEQDVQD
eukprot:5159461-Karenia_brevis.AAC.1